ncbi:uncharacterized protein [Anoplolepis gracilipes]|uniref:uncharacterized protein isoform X2 n=2 Tax=Anoplolepis gracilipes TaxID=354296 RepID=UPI003BA28521
MTGSKEDIIYTFDNFELKWWLRRAGNENRRMLLLKLKDDLKKLQLSKRAVHRGLMQLTRKTYVILDKRLADSCRRKVESSLEHSSLENKLIKTSVPIQLKKHCSKSSINPSKNDKIVEKQYKQVKEQKGETASSSSKIKSLDSQIQERNYESRSNDILCERNVNVLDDTISNLKTCLKTGTNNITNENQSASVLNVQTSRVDSELLSQQTHTPTNIIVKRDIQENLFRDGNVKTELTDLQKDSLSVEIDFKTADKKRTRSESSEESVMKKRKEKKKASPDKLLDENLVSDTKIFDGEIFSEDNRIHNNNESEKQMYWEKTTDYMTKEREVYKCIRQRRKLKRQNKSIRKKYRNLFGGCFSKSESDEDRKIILERLEKRKLQSVSNNSKIYDTFHDLTTEEEMEDERDEISTYKHNMSVNNSQEDTESVISIKVESVNSNDSTICIENDMLHDLTTDEEQDEKINFNKDETSIRKRNVSVCISQETIESAISAKIQRIENSSSIVDTKIVNKNDTSEDVEMKVINMPTKEENQENVENINLANENIKIPKDRRPNIILSTKKEDVHSTQENQENINLADEDVKILKDIKPNVVLSTKERNRQETQENVDLANLDIKIPKDIRPNIVLTKPISTMFPQDLMSNIKEKDECNVSHNVENKLLTNKESIAGNRITECGLITSLKLEEDLPKKKDVVNEALSSPITNVSSKRSDTSDDNSSTDDDNMSDIEVEIKIKPKSKSRISRKFSLKAPLSAVNTCIKNLNTLKKNPDFLGELFQMNLKTSSETSKHGHTVRSEENEAKNTSEKSSDNNEDVTAETALKTQEVICNSSHTIKDNANYSSKQQRQQNFQDDQIFDRDENATQNHQEEKNKNVQSAEQKKRQLTSETDSESAKSARDASDLETQLSKSFFNEKEKTAGEQQQNSQDIILNEGAMDHEQKEKNTERVQSVEGKEMRMAVENNVESAKSACEMPDLQKQLPKTSSETLVAKHTSEVRVQTDTEFGFPLSCRPVNLSKNLDASITSSNTHSVPSASSTHGPSPSYSSTSKPAYQSPMMNVPAKNIPSSFNDDIKLVQNGVVNICWNFSLCRNIVRESIFNDEKMYEMKMSIIRIYQDLNTLKMMLRGIKDEYIVDYINQQKLLSPLISLEELNHYMILYQNYISIVKYAPLFCDPRYSNMLQFSNINNKSVPRTSVQNVHAQPPLLGNVPGTSLPGTTSRMQHLGTQSSTMPHPRPNINRQSSKNTGNPSRLRQPVPIRPKVSFTGTSTSNPISSPVINAQSVGNANSIQDQHMLNTNMLNINNQQYFINLANGSYMSLTSSGSNINNIRTYPPAQPMKTNVSSTTDKRYFNNELKSTTVSSSAARFANMQQQTSCNQTSHSQVPLHVNSAVPHFPTDQNVNEMDKILYQITQQSKGCTNVNALRNGTNVTRNIGPGNQFVNPQTLPVPAERMCHFQQCNKNVPTSFTSQSARAHVQNISSNSSQQQQRPHYTLPISTSVNLISSSSNSVSQNAQPSVPNKRPGMPETQTRDYVPNKTPFTKPQQDVRQGTSRMHNVCVNAYECIYNVSQKSSGISSKAPVSQEPRVSQNATFNAALPKNKIILTSSKTTPVPSNEIVSHYFNLNILTELQKFILKDQLKYYLEHCLFKQQDSEKFHFEKKILVSFYESLRNYTDKIINKNYIEKKLQNDTSGKTATVPSQQSEIKSSHNKIQSNKNNNSIYDNVQEKQSLEKNTYPNALINSKSTTVTSDSSIETQNKESRLQTSLTPQSTITKELYPKLKNLLQQNVNTPKMRFKKSMSSAMNKQFENINTSVARHSNIPEENPIAKTSYRISVTKEQDDTKIARSVAEISHDKRTSESCSPLAQDTSSSLRTALSYKIKGCSKVTKDDAKEISKISNFAISNITENNTIIHSSFNTETQEHIKYKETVKSPDVHKKRLSKSCSSPAQNKKLSLLQDDEMKDDNVEGSDNAEMTNICKIFNVAVLNSNRGNEKAASQVPCNTEVQDKELYHNEIAMCDLTNNKTSDKNSQDGTRDNVKKKTTESKSNVTEAQSDTSCILRTSTPFVPDNTSELLYPTNRSKFAETSQIGTLLELFLNLKQKNYMNEQINDSKKMCESYESSGHLHIDESAKKLNLDSQEEQRDKATFSEKDKPNMSQDLCFNETLCKSEIILPFTENYELEMEETNIQNQNEKLKQEKIQAEETLQSEILEDTLNTRTSNPVQSIDTIEDVKEKQVQMDTHSGVKAINELLRHMSEHKCYGKRRTSSCNSTMKSNVTNKNVNEASIDKNDILNVNDVSPTKSKDDNENSTVLNILDVRTISPSLFEEIDNSNALSQDDLMLLNEKEKSSIVNDNLEAPNSVSLIEIKVEELSDLNDNPKVLDSASLNEVKKENSLNVNDNPEGFDLTLLNEKKEEQSSDVNDNLDVFNLSLNEMNIEKSFDTDNPDNYNFVWLNEMKMEELLEDHPEIPDSMSLNETKEKKSSVVGDNEVHNSALLNEIKEEKSSDDMNDNSEDLDEMENRPCLRCKCKSMVYCQACLEAPYCSKRCSDLHWKAVHYKQCKKRYKSIICINL